MDHRDPIVLELIARREALGMSQREVARALGVSSATPNMWERGLNQPTLGKLRDWAGVLGMTLEVADDE